MVQAKYMNTKYELKNIAHLRVFEPTELKLTSPPAMNYSGF